MNPVGCEECVAKAIAMFSWRAELSPVKDAFFSQVGEEYSSIVFANTASGRGSVPKTGSTEYVLYPPAAGYQERAVGTFHQGVGTTQATMPCARFALARGVVATKTFRISDKLLAEQTAWRLMSGLPKVLAPVQGVTREPESAQDRR